MSRTTYYLIKLLICFLVVSVHSLSQYASSSSQRPKTIPVLSPIPGGKPLLIGDDLVLSNLSPLQWTTLEECIHNHNLCLQEETEVDVVGIDAAPLVAVMDEITSRQSMDNKNTKYASIAAIVGVAANSNTANGEDFSLDTSSQTSFMESIQNIRDNSRNKMMIPSECSFRLVGIGRAAISGFHSRLSNSYWQAFDEKQLGYREQESDEAPLLLTQFQLLIDTDQRSMAAQKRGRAQFCSPAHAIAEMSQWAGKLNFMHEDRQRLVRGLKAAKARLEASNLLLEDYDGIGMLSSGFIALDDEDRAKTQPDIDKLLNDYPGTRAPSQTDGLSSAMEKVEKWENFGLGYSSAAFASIPPLTRTLMEKLQAYYSPHKQATEEHYYEVLSFMAVLSLKESLSPASLDFALKCTNTMERMMWAHEKMTEHRLLLKQASEEISSDLRDCGEECTDLW